jgi:hypothetical protein
MLLREILRHNANRGQVSAKLDNLGQHGMYDHDVGFAYMWNRCKSGLTKGKVNMIMFFLTHALMILLSIPAIAKARLVEGNVVSFNPMGYALLVASLLSLVRLSIGRIFVRGVSFVYMAISVYDLFQNGFRWVPTIELAMFGFIYLSLGPSSWWHDLYTPAGVFTRFRGGARGRKPRIEGGPE